MKLRTLTAAAAIATGLVLAPATMASAAPAPAAVASIDLTCKDVPTPVMPDRGVTGSLLSAPKAASTADPATTPGVTWFEQYGPNAGWGNYDLGCGPDTVKDPEGASGTTLANWFMLFPQAWIATTAALTDAVYDAGAWLHILDPIWETIGSALQDSITTPFAPIVGIVVLIALSMALVRGRVATFLGVAGVTVIAAGLAVTGGTYPAKAGASTDAIITQASTAVRDQINGTVSTDPGVAMVGSLSDRIVYDQWVTGSLGDASSPTAVKFGPCLYKASHYSWTEAAAVESDPDGQGKSITEGKADSWKDCAGQVQDDDPDAYQTLAGHNGSSRVWASALANIECLAVLPMLFVAMLLTAMAFLIIRVVVVFLPVLALFIVVQAALSARSGSLKPTILKSVASTFGAAVINGIVFSAVASVNAVVAIRVLNEDRLPFPVRLLIVAAFTVLMWVLSKPFRKLTRMVSNYDPINVLHETGDKIADAIRSVVGAAVGSATGNVVANEVNGHRDQPDAAATSAGEAARGPRFTRPTIDPLPVGEAVVNDGAHTASGHVALDAAPSDATYPELEQQHAPALPAGTGNADTSVVIVNDRTQPAAEVHHYPGPVEDADGNLIHHGDSPAGGHAMEYTRTRRDGGGTFVVFDPEQGLTLADDKESTDA